MASGRWVLGLALAAGVVFVQADLHVRAESYVVTDGYEAKPDNDPFHYFPTRPFLREGMEDMAADLNRYANVTATVRDALLEELDTELKGTAFFFSADFVVEALYHAAIEAGDCRLAEDQVWRRLVQMRPFIVGFSEDSAFVRHLRQRLYQKHFPALAACLYAYDARTLSFLIARHSLEVTGTRTLVRPFLHHQSWFSARNTLHGRRDDNFWQLIEMATGPSGPNYTPAGVMLVELALELDSLDLPDDVLHMLLLRAERTWPDDERSLSVTRERIAELLALTAGRLTPEDLAHAERCFLTEEPYRRLFLGEQAYWNVPATERCVASAP